MPDDAPLSLDFVPPLSLGTGPSLLLDVALLGLALGALLVGLRVHARRLDRARARERAQLIEHAPLREGASAVLEGNIDSREPGAPVRVTVTEPRSDVLPSGFGDVTRHVDARPFDLATTTGSVRVEPGSNLLVAAELDLEELGPVARVRRAHLEHGNRVIAYGTLRRERHAFAGYRGGAEGWTLRAPRGGRMLLADAALATRYDDRIRVLRRFTSWALPLWIAFHAFCTFPFLVGSFTGIQTRTALIEWDDVVLVQNTVPRHYRIHTRTNDGLVLDARITAATGDALRNHMAAEIPLLRSSWKPACYVGGEPWTLGIPVVGGLAAVLLALLVLRVRYRAATPWYDRA